MSRLFREHKLRSSMSLDGMWAFSTDQDKRGETEGWQHGFNKGKDVYVPSCWNLEGGLRSYEGVCWYERSFYSEGGTVRIIFGAVMTEAKVWLDGEYLGYHYGGFSQFDFIINDLAEGEHRLTVMVDNTFTQKSIPQATVDWYHYGGITREVTLETIEGVAVLSNRLEYELSESLGSATATLVVELYNSEMREATVPVVATLDGARIAEGVATIAPRSTSTVTFSDIALSDIELWNIGAPRLYELHITTPTDDLFDRVGFRRIETHDSAIFLNGKKIEIRGVNRHDEHPEFGFAFPISLMSRDIDIITDMGCNSIRGSHYPNNQYFVDMLDERGILFWSEIPIWGGGFSEDALGDEDVVARGLEMHREMVKYYYNHPSILIWGMHNEIKVDTAAARAMTERYYTFLKENGGNRLVVYATDKPFIDTCYTHTDVICLNQYFGWYYGHEDGAWESFFVRLGDRFRELGLEDKTVIMSEFGVAALYGCHDDETLLWSEENQAKRIRECLTLFHKEPCVSGAFIWQYADMRTCRQAGVSRARGFNNKGIVNEHRKPKLAYYAAKECYTSFAEEED